MNISINKYGINFRTIFLCFAHIGLDKVTEMEDKEADEENRVEKVSVLNTILDGLVTDASDLVKDLSWGVKTYLLFGLMSILFGVQELIYNIDLLQERLYIPLFIAGAMIFSGSVQILNFIRLRSKYSRLFKVQEELSKQ